MSTKPVTVRVEERRLRRLMRARRLTSQSELMDVGRARLQDDLLLAATARHAGAVLLTADAHFARLQRHVRFPMRQVRLGS